jgi:hypothetical protein
MRTYGITTHLFAIMQILIENHWKVRKCKLLILLAIFHSQMATLIPLNVIKFVNWFKTVKISLVQIRILQHVLVIGTHGRFLASES